MITAAFIATIFCAAITGLAWYSKHVGVASEEEQKETGFYWIPTEWADVVKSALLTLVMGVFTLAMWVLS